MAHMKELIAICGVGEPDLKCIRVDTAERVWIIDWGGRPKVGASAQRLLELKWRINLLWIIDWANAAVATSVRNLSGYVC
jgi:hypothetical protein